MVELQRGKQKPWMENRNKKATFAFWNKWYDFSQLGFYKNIKMLNVRNVGFFPVLSNNYLHLYLSAVDLDAKSELSVETKSVVREVVMSDAYWQMSVSTGGDEITCPLLKATSTWLPAGAAS